jgi:hypothetical protein
VLQTLSFQLWVGKLQNSLRDVVLLLPRVPSLSQTTTRLQKAEESAPQVASDKDLAEGRCDLATERAQWTTKAQAAALQEWKITPRRQKQPQGALPDCFLTYLFAQSTSRTSFLRIA